MIRSLLVLTAIGLAAPVCQLYEDADDGFGYRSGDYRLTTWAATRDTSGTMVLQVAAVEGKRGTTVRKIRIGLLEGDRQISWSEMAPSCAEGFLGVTI